MTHILNAMPLKAVPIFRVWTYAQDICPYTHEPVTEQLILSDEYRFPNTDRLAEIAAQSNLTLGDLNIEQTTRYS